MGPSARSGYLCTALDWKTERRRSEVCKESAVQKYPYLERGDLKNSISFDLILIVTLLTLFFTFLLI